MAAGLNSHITEFYKKLTQLYQKNKDSGNPSFNFLWTFTQLCQDIELHRVASGTGFTDRWMCPIFKKKDPTDIANYRPIMVLNNDYKLFMKPLTLKLTDVVDEERASAQGKTNISRKLANPHRALRTTRQSNTRTTALIFRVFVRSEGELYEVSISM